MNRVKNFIIVLIFVLVGIPAIGCLLNMAVPGLGEIFAFFGNMLWQLIKEYVLVDKLQMYGLYIVMLIALNCIGIYLSRKQENALYEIITLVLSFVGIATGNIL